jgi:mono/diheme cytochrome c family protein
VTRRLVGAGAVLLGVLTLSATRQADRIVFASPGTVAPEPPSRLTETGLYADGRIGEIDTRVQAYAPQYPLWSDGMTKRRWILLPAGATIDATDEDAWAFPVGTRLWKEFSLGDRRIETRMFWRASATAWVSATYVWNEDGTDAELAPSDGIPAYVEVAPGRRHSIPGRTDCAACHGPNDRPRVLGFNALQLSTDRDPAAIHGEPLRPGMLTLRTLEEQGLLTPSRPSRITAPPRVRTSDPATRTMLGYLAANCGVCHNGNGEIAGFSASLAYRDVVADGDAVARSLIGRRTRWQIPGTTDGSSVLVQPGAHDKSAIYVRMKSRSPSSQMAPLGSVVRDDEAVDALARWIDVTLAPSH